MLNWGFERPRRTEALARPWLGPIYWLEPRSCRQQRPHWCTWIFAQ